MILLDHAATTPVARAALEAMWPYLTGEFGNPSSTHAFGDRAARALQDARRDVAGLFGGRPSEVTFTASGTEAINTAVKGIVLASTRGRHVVTTAVEHEATLASLDHLRRRHGVEVEVVGVDSAGRVDPDEIGRALRPETALVTVMAANNEIGTIQDTRAIGDACRAVGVPLHVDAVQAAGWLPVDRDALGADAISISGHKLGAPKGVGALWTRGRLPVEALVHGGGQERGRRSGTENVAFAVALAAAVRELRPEDRDRRATEVAAARDAFVDAVGDLPIRFTGSETHRLPSIASFVAPGRSGESILLDLEERGVVVSSGSACAAGRDEPSHVLLACGVDPAEALTAVRLSFGHDSTRADALGAAAALRDVLG